MGRAAAARASTAPARVRPRPAGPSRGPARRRSGPAPARRPAKTQRRTLPKVVPPVARRGLSGVLDRLLRGRGWIALIGALLVGVVFLNVGLLDRGNGVARDAERVEELGRENAELRSAVARLGSSERIQRVAAERGLVLPEPGDVRYLRANPKLDAKRAAARIAPPQATAEATPPPRVEPANPQAQDGTPGAVTDPTATPQVTPAPEATVAPAEPTQVAAPPHDGAHAGAPAAAPGAGTGTE